MAAWLLSVVTVIYVGVAGSYLYDGNVNMAIVFAGYALANIGFILAG